MIRLKEVIKNGMRDIRINKLICNLFIIVCLCFIANPAWADKKDDLEKWRSKIKSEAIPKAELQVEKAVGSKVSIILQMDEFPEHVGLYEQFYYRSIPMLSKALTNACKSPEFCKYIGSQFNTVEIIHDGTLDRTKYELDKNKKSFRIIFTISGWDDYLTDKDIIAKLVNSYKENLKESLLSVSVENLGPKDKLLHVDNLIKADKERVLKHDEAFERILALSKSDDNEELQNKIDQWIFKNGLYSLPHEKKLREALGEWADRKYKSFSPDMKMKVLKLFYTRKAKTRKSVARQTASFQPGLVALKELKRKGADPEMRDFIINPLDKKIHHDNWFYIACFQEKREDELIRYMMKETDNETIRSMTMNILDMSSYDSDNSDNKFDMLMKFWKPLENNQEKWEAVASGVLYYISRQRPNVRQPFGNQVTLYLWPFWSSAGEKSAVAFCLINTVSYQNFLERWRLDDPKNRVYVTPEMMRGVVAFNPQIIEDILIYGRHNKQWEMMKKNTGGLMVKSMSPALDYFVDNYHKKNWHRVHSLFNSLIDSFRGNNDKAELAALKNYIENKIRTAPSTAKTMPLDRLK